MYDDAPFDKAKAFQMLRKRGVVKAVVSYEEPHSTDRELAL